MKTFSSSGSIDLLLSLLKTVSSKSEETKIKSDLDEKSFALWTSSSSLSAALCQKGERDFIRSRAFLRYKRNQYTGEFD